MNQLEFTQKLKDFAIKERTNLIGIAPIERFKNAPPQHPPLSIFPHTKSVVVIGAAIPRGTKHEIEEGTS